MAEVFLNQKNPAGTPDNVPVDSTPAAPDIQKQYNDFVDKLPPVAPQTSESTPSSLGAGPPGVFDKIVGGLTHYVQGVGSDYMNMTQNMGNEIKLGGEGKQSPVTSGLATASEFAKGVFSPVTHAIGPIVDASFHGLNNLIDLGTGKPMGTTTANQDAESQYWNGQLQDLAQKHPEGFKNLSSLANIVMAAGGEKGADETGANLDVGKSAEAAKAAIDAAKQLSPSELATQKNLLLDNATRDATPTLKEASGDKYQTIRNKEGDYVGPKINEGKGVFGKRTVNPTLLNQDAAAELAKSPGYKANVNGTALEKFNAVQPELIAKNNALSEALAQEKFSQGSTQIYAKVSAALNELPGKSLILEDADPAINKYMKVFLKALDANKGEDGKIGLDGEMKIRQTMDRAYENTRGNNAFPAGSDKLAALDEVNRTARNILNQDVIDNAKNTDVKAALKSEWDLHRASDELWTKANNEAPSRMGRFAQRHPGIANFGRYITRYGIRRGIMHP